MGKGLSSQLAHDIELLGVEDGEGHFSNAERSSLVPPQFVQARDLMIGMQFSFGRGTTGGQSQQRTVHHADQAPARADRVLCSFADSCCVWWQI